MKIRNEEINDTNIITEILYKAFLSHPQHAPGSEPVEHLIVKALRKDNALLLSLVVEVNMEVVGHIAFSPASLGIENNGWVLLGPVGVLPKYQKQGIGSNLIMESILRLRGTETKGIVLVGDPVFYLRFGFKSYPKLGYPGVPGEYVLALPLTGEEPEGIIIAHNAFNIH